MVERTHGIPFFDEGERLKHDAPYLLTTASDYHKYTIGSRFFITSNELHELDGTFNVMAYSTCFQETCCVWKSCEKIEQVQTFPDGRPERPVIITAFGFFDRFQFAFRRKTFEKKKVKRTQSC